jgi:transporter family-2 protein
VGNRPGVSRSVAFICTLIVGGLAGIQPAANAAMAKHVSDIGAAAISITISFAILMTLLLVVGHPGRLSGLSAFRPEWALGGIAGAAIVAVSLVAVRPLGVGVLIALLVAGQLAAGLLADRYHWFGIHHAPLSLGRLAGFVLVVGGTVLITRA